MSYDQEQKTAIAAVEKACRLCRAVQAGLLSADTVAKEDRSPVTVADLGVQAVVTAELTQAFPDIPLVGEEDADPLRGDSGAALRRRVVESVAAVWPNLKEPQVLQAIDYGTHAGGAEGRFWALDPIDGTKGFLRGDQYAVALALIEDGEVVLGVLGCPHLPVDADRPEMERGCIFAAVDGHGAVVRHARSDGEQRIHVTDVADPAKASFCESVEAAHSDQSDSARVAALLGVTVPPLRIDSQCKYAAIARGDSSVYLRLPTRADYEEKIWDHAAGYIVVKEAGGAVTDIRGKALDFSAGRTLRNNTGVLATNQRLHDRVVAAIGEVVGGD